MSAAPRNTMNSTKINCITESLYLLKNQRATRGKVNTMNEPSATTLIISQIKNKSLVSPLYIPPITAKTNRVSVSVTAVPPTAMLTLRCSEAPYLSTMG